MKAFVWCMSVVIALPPGPAQPGETLREWQAPPPAWRYREPDILRSPAPHGPATAAAVQA